MAKDLFHNAVRHALEKDGWTVTDDPLSFKIGGINFYVDLAAEKMIVATRESERIAVEVKSFIKQSPLTAFHEALGQYENYLIALESYNPDIILYLAVPTDVYNVFFQKPFIQLVLERKQIKLILYNPTTETIELWKK